MTDHERASPQRLLPCPFCGKQPRSQWNGADGPHDDMGYWGIDCCGAFAHEDDEETAVKLWNTRAPSPAGKAIALALKLRGMALIIEDDPEWIAALDMDDDEIVATLKAASEALEGSSAVEQDAVNVPVAGSIPAPSANYFKEMKPPFEVYNTGYDVADVDGHVCSCETKEYALEIATALNLAYRFYPQQRSQPESVGLGDVVEVISKFDVFSTAADVGRALLSKFNITRKA